MSKDNALIVFVKEPVAGAVKTRLAATIGEEKALTIYKDLLAHTQQVSDDFDRFVFYSGRKSGIRHFDKKQDCWVQQVAGDLGARMSAAFHTVFNKGYAKVLIIGSDCPGLTKAIIQNGFDALHEQNAVIGPTEDGGYYLLGFKQANDSVFVDMPWSTNKVAAITKARLGHGKFTELEMLRDVDYEEDLNAVGWKIP